MYSTGTCNENEREQFESLVRPVSEWLRKNGHPHMKVLILPTHAEIMEGLEGFSFDEDECAEVKEEHVEFFDDRIVFDLKDGENCEAIPVKEEDDGTVYCFLDCLAEEHAMQEDGEFESYEKSDLRKWLNSTVLNRIPDKLRASMVPFESGDLLRIPTEKEIFGENEIGVAEGDDVKQFEPMKLRRNRVACLGLNGGPAWYWLQNRSVYSAAWAASVNRHGHATRGDASDVHAVRPLFKIAHH